MKRELLFIMRLTAFVSVGFSAACADLSPDTITTRYDHQVVLGKATLQTEIADTPKTMQQGMMYRKDMADNQAMLFLFEQPKRRFFWMKNTLIALDMIFLDDNGIVTEIKPHVPPCRTDDCPLYPSHSDNILYVVEVKGGIAEKAGINVGDKLGICRE